MSLSVQMCLQWKAVKLREGGGLHHTEEYKRQGQPEVLLLSDQPERGRRELENTSLRTPTEEEQAARLLEDFSLAIQQDFRHCFDKFPPRSASKPIVSLSPDSGGREDGLSAMDQQLT
ncbi:hypothetical protein EYF80_029811 [Liparis tanakae]|uniref:Uncharacterized protein n=1 Tax=Liparis tanakae TaxID=230148 RepID=A0A4Z2H2G9_9TELE|nr:hypothetical protein EYF80_029811 [Liparis tanakae]